MAIKEIYFKALNIISQGKIEKTSENHWDVDDEEVWINTKPGRSVLECSCFGCSKFPNENVLCKRKIAVMIHESYKYIGERK